MTTLDRNIRQFVLRALLASKDAPLPDDTLKGTIRAAFPNVAFTDGDLTQHIKELEAAGIIAGTNDDISGVVWQLSLKGKIKAQQL